MIGMREVLTQVEKELPALLENPHGWQSLDIDYHNPRVERVWTQWNGFRINLHRIQACKPHEALFHPHPWPSVVRILGGELGGHDGGGYWTAIGSGPPDGEDPLKVAEIFMPNGSIICMEDPYGWHLVAPPHTSYSLMITGGPWHTKMTFKPGMKLRSMNEKDIEELKYYFKSYYAL